METQRFEVWFVQIVHGREKWGRHLGTYATREEAEIYRVKHVAPHYHRSGVRPVQNPAIRLVANA